MSKKIWWSISLLISLIFSGVIYLIWDKEVNHYDAEIGQLSSQSDVDEYFKNNLDERSGFLYIPTGVFIQSLKFVNASDVNITGYIWQKYDDDLPNTITKGVIFPEQVYSVNTTFNKEYDRTNDGETVVGWYFDVTLRQPFDYSKYPLDKQKVWIRMWHKDFDSNVVLTPDLEAYDSTKDNEIFGIDPDFVSGGWTINETFFQYKLTDYDTNFGIESYVGKTKFPELHFNIAVVRDFKNTFIINLVPLIIVASMLFSVLMITTSRKDKIAKFGFSVSGALGTASALFFVVMLAHIQVRQQFPGAGIVYIEQFYLIIYVMVLLLSLNVYFFSIGDGDKGIKFIQYNDNLIPKVTFWPIILGTLAVITYSYF